MYKKIINISVLPVLLVLPAFATETISERMVLAGDTVLDDYIISDISNNEIGGAILSNGKIVIKNSDIKNNIGGAAGALYDNSLDAFHNGSEVYSVTIDNSYITNNTAGDFGAVAIFTPNSTVSNSQFSNNRATANYANLGDGAGALMLGSESQTIVYRDTFSNNSSGTVGGAVATRPINYWLDTNYSGKGTNSSIDGKVDIIYSQFYNNVAGTRGGAFFNSFYNSKNKEGYAYVQYSTFDTNTANKGGAVFVEGWTDASGNNAKLWIDNSTFVRNSATQFGGAIYNESELVIKDTRVYRTGGGAFSRNTAVKGGAIYNEGSLSIDGVTFVGNTATGSGGAIENKDTSAELVLNNVTFTENDADWAGAILARGNTTITGGSFTGNTSNDGGGAIYLATLGNKGHTLDINGTTFTNNGTLGVDVDGGGAIGSFSNLIVKNAKFTGNYVGVDGGGITSDGGGAIFMGSVSNNVIEDSIFTNNTSKTWGGAISTRDTNKGDNDLNPATLDIARSIFSGNSADKGGAIYNTFHSSATNDQGVYIIGSTFNGNTANQGGAIYNSTSGEKDLVGGALLVKNSTFSNNIANQGGAIYNEGNLGFIGTNVFKNNIADGVANDIKNMGILDIIDGTTTLNGGITGNGTLIVEDTGVLNLGTTSVKQANLTLDGIVNAELKATDDFASFYITNTFDGDGTLNLTLKGAGEYQVFENQVFDPEHVNVLSSNIYTYDWNNNHDTLFVSTKSVEEIVENTGISEKTIVPVLTMTNSSSGSLQDLANKILEKIDGSADNKSVVDVAVKTIHPETEAVVQSMATSVQTTVGNLAASRMSVPSVGRAGGDVKPTGAGFWANGLYNRTNQDGLFTGYTRGFAIGMDATFNKVLTLGTGYSYAHSNIGATHRGTNIDSYTMFIYGQYKPNRWYANAVLNYTRSDYSEHGSTLGVEVTSDYDVHAYGARLATGYDLKNGATPELGLRYTHIDADDYQNNLGIKNSLKSTDYMTLTLGGKYARKFKTKIRYISLLPEAHGALKYDIVSDKQVAVVTMPGVDSYSISGERLARFGVELGMGLTMKYYNADWTLDYDFEVRQDYTSHTGRIKWRYNF